MDLQQANLNHKEELTNKLANNNLLAEQYQTYQTLQGCNSLQDLLISVYVFQIEKIKTNQFIVNSIMKEHPQLDNTFMYWKYFELFTFKFKYSDNEDAIFDIIPVDTRIKLATFIYSHYNSDALFYSKDQEKVENMFKAIKGSIPGLDERNDFNQNMVQIINPLFKNYRVFDIEPYSRVPSGNSSYDSPSSGGSMDSIDLFVRPIGKVVTTTSEQRTQEITTRVQPEPLIEEPKHRLANKFINYVTKKLGF
uniref:Uncharacterized protein n=1 Tax=Porodaedalea pini TaxID=108901 RepID=A0A5B9RCB8_9AGAM|nr:hypothetical protein PPIT_000076 [Porodaedalea pini]QEG56959.1 hypothetical protein PPIT_000076 [Porodaedalea pini]